MTGQEVWSRTFFAHSPSALLKGPSPRRRHGSEYDTSRSSRREGRDLGGCSPLSSFVPTVGLLSQAVGLAGSLGNGPNFPLLSSI